MQYAFKRFAEALEVIPRTIAENAGLNAPAMISSLYAAHEAGNVNAGIDIAVREMGVSHSRLSLISQCLHA